jgi:hypothetical protein
MKFSDVPFQDPSPILADVMYSKIFVELREALVDLR